MDKDIEQYINDTIIERPYGFTAGKKHFYFYPVTLGKMLLLKRLIDSLEINQKNLQKNVPLEAMRLVNEKKDICLTVIVYHTCRTREELHDNELVEERKKCLEKELSEDEIVSLLIVVLTADKTEIFFKHLGIDKEQDRMSSVMKVKSSNDKNNLTFGGLSVFGTLLDSACERYGWTKEYVVWGIDYTSLRLMLADKISSVYVTDEESKKLPANIRVRKGDMIKADDPKNRDLIKNMSWK